MKRTTITTAILSSTLLFSTLLSAEEVNKVDETLKQWSVGVSSYVISIDDADYGDDTFEGYSFSAGYAFSDSLAVRGQFYSTEHELTSDLELSGIDVNVFYGTGLATEGFKAYVGVGFYSETLKETYYEIDEDFSGVQLSGGIGYNWDSLSLELAIALRSTGDYEDLSESDMAAAAGSLILSYRF